MQSGGTPPASPLPLPRGSWEGVGVRYMRGGPQSPSLEAPGAGGVGAGSLQPPREKESRLEPGRLKHWRGWRKVGCRLPASPHAMPRGSGPARGR